MRSIDITGRRFGRLTVLGFSHHVAQYKHWAARCDCGAETTVRGTSLTSGNTTQCKRCSELKRRGNTFTRKHGHSSQNGVKKATATYESWKAMMARCYNPNNASWQHYGGKGIVVCDRWHDFKAFLADMGERPAGMTLHRIDHNGHYEPGNCEWRRMPH